MRAKNYKSILTAIAAVFVCIPVLAQKPKEKGVEENVITVTKVFSDSTKVEASFTDFEQAQIYASGNQVTPSSTLVTPKSGKMSHLMVGVELGTGLDLSGSDMSTFNADIVFGYRYKAIQLLGIGAGIHKSLGTRDNFIPIYGIFRTGFMARPTLLFMQISAGYGFNTISSSAMFGDVTANIGLGVNLVQKPRFQSNIILALGFRHLSERHQQMAQLYKPNIGFAQISFGISM